MTEKKRRPELQFKGFTDDWEQRKLSDEFIDFIVPMRDKPKEFGGEIPWTRIEDIEGKYLNDTLSDQYVTEETVKKMNLKIIPKDSLIVSSSATFGVVAVVTQDLITNQTFIGLVPNDKDLLDYWYAFFHSDSARQYMKLQSAGSTIFYIARDNFEIMPIVIPAKHEMLRIGAYFSQLDNLITLHQRKHDRLLNFKKSMLEKLFPQKGSAYPELRFDGFTNQWEQRKLGTQMYIKSRIGWQALTKKEYLNTGEYYLITGTDIDESIHSVNLSRCYFVSKERYEMDEKIQVHEGDIIVTKDGTIGKVAMVTGLDKPATLNSHLFVLRDLSGNLDNRFLLHVLCSHVFDSFVESTKTGSTLTGMPQKTFVNFQFLIPELKEQKRISRYLDAIDNLITLHKDKLEKLKHLKQSMLQKMFV